MQHPILMGHDGGAQLSEAEADAEWLAAWAGIAEACDVGLMRLHRLHPRRDELMALAQDARAAAQLPDAPRLRTA